ncbi:zincin-like metallopeptidase domain-containing protein [Sphingomonas sp. QA11]|uniref:ArdC family protein n=1 Tax=Sphingomonas sp. QA11 TaxID=2950605 RepID=UPI00234946E1|nr:zincin-like metallopeptidase domain-containing protein [Sphingomonas sp. QA11]WCM26000.1 zincin-like metallopeptidase domain-containing protein [Sphingomonas sp. QA11]
MRQKSNRRARGKPRTDRTSASEPRASLYDEVTHRIVAELEAGRFPWVQPWARSGGTGPCLPRNALTARSYSGVNVLILWGAVIEHGWPSQSWLTFKQALEAGGCVRKGEQGTTVVYADRFVPKEVDKVGLRGSAAPANEGEPPEAKSIPFLKRFTVFNVAQCEGLREGLGADPAPLPEREIVPVAENVIAASGVDFRIGGDKAFYVPSLDFVQVPPQPAFFDQINYYRTALHELCHATGHGSRLDRKLTTGFGTRDYAREELCAEMGSAFLCAALGIVPTVRHADYLAVWLEVLREDSRAIFRAASAASKAADWLLTRHAAAQGEAIQAASGEWRTAA